MFHRATTALVHCSLLEGIDFKKPELQGCLGGVCAAIWTETLHRDFYFLVSSFYFRYVHPYYY
jgi:hypothetical protein